MIRKLPHIEQYAVGPRLRPGHALGGCDGWSLLGISCLPINSLFCLAVEFDWLSSLTQVMWRITECLNLRPSESVLKCLELSEFIAIPFTGSAVIRMMGWMYTQSPLHMTSHLLSCCLLIRTIPYVRTVRAGGYLLEDRNLTWPLTEPAHTYICHISILFLKISLKNLLIIRYLLYLVSCHIPSF